MNNVLIASISLIVSLSVMAPTAEAATNSKLDPIPNIACPPNCVSQPSFRNFADKVINNTGHTLAQAERGEADEAVRRNAENQWQYNDADLRERSRNRENRLASAYTGDRANRASASLGLEYAAVQTIGTVGNTSGATENALVETFAQFNDAAFTDPAISSGTKKLLDRAFAFGCAKKCFDKAMAAALSRNRAIGSCPAGEANVAFNPTELRRRLPQQKSISLSPQSDDVGCLAAFNFLAHAASGIDDVLLDDKANSAQAAQVTARKAQVQNAVLASVRPLMSDMSLPNQAVSNTKQYDTKEKAAKTYGVDCRRAGDLPSQKCSTAWQLSATRAQLDQQARQIDTSPAQADMTAAILSASAAGIQQSAYGHGTSSIAFPEENELGKLIVSYFDNAEIVAYMNSPEFGKNVALAMLEVPRIEQRVVVAMNDYWDRSSTVYREYDLAQIYPDVFGAYYASKTIPLLKPPHSASSPSLAEFMGRHGIHNTTDISRGASRTIRIAARQ